MTPFFLKSKSLALTATACVLALALTLSAKAQVTVFDPANYAQNILTASRALQEVNNQIKSLSNEAQMLQNMAKSLKTLNISDLARINSDLNAINELMGQAKGITYNLSQTQAAFKAQFPNGYAANPKTAKLIAEAQARWQSIMGAYENTLNVQAQIDQNLRSDTHGLASLLSASEASEGSLQAQQAANQLLALSTKQQMQIEALMMAQYRAEALDQARKAQAEAAAKAATTRFLGSGKAYTTQ